MKFFDYNDRIIESDAWQDDFKWKIIETIDNYHFLVEDRSNSITYLEFENIKETLPEKCNVRDKDVLKHLEIWKPLTDNEEKIKSNINELFDSTINFLTILGSVGIGKTFTTCLTCFERRQTSFYYTTEYDLLNAYYKPNFLFFIENLKEMPLLIIDEIGRSFFKDKSTLENLLSERYQRNNKTILISNKTPEEIATYFDLYIFDRVFKSNKSKCISFTGESLRQFNIE